MRAVPLSAGHVYTWFPYILPDAHPGSLLRVRQLVAGALVTEERQACTWDSRTSLHQPVLSAPVPPEHPPPKPEGERATSGHSGGQ